MAFPGAEHQSTASLKFAVYCTMVAEGGEERFNFFWTKLQHESGNPGERLNQLTALGCSKDVFSLQVKTLFD